MAEVSSGQAWALIVELAVLNGLVAAVGLVGLVLGLRRRNGGNSSGR